VGRFRVVLDSLSQLQVAAPPPLSLLGLERHCPAKKPLKISENAQVGAKNVPTHCSGRFPVLRCILIRG
jgi:hypothetical protein